jgi:hypothetical protein
MGRKSSIHSYHDMLHIVVRDLCRRNGALRPVILHGLDVLSCQTVGFMGVVMLRVSSSALYIGGGPTFGCDTFSGDQLDPGHGDPVAFLHELRLRKHTAVAGPKTRRNTRLQARPYLHNSKAARLRRHKSTSDKRVGTKMEIVLPNLST